jgi:hypothetical protein
MKVALVVIAIGDKYLSDYNRIFRSSHETYALKYGYDFKLITDYLDPSLRNKYVISFNKILVCSQPWSDMYDYIIVVDADILINSKAPPLHVAYKYGDKIGIVDEYSQPTQAMRIEIQRLSGSEDNAIDYYYLHVGKHIITDKVFNTGVMVLQPLKHRDFLQAIYNKYSKNAVEKREKSFHYEQASIGYEIQSADAYIILDNKWNAIWTLESSMDVYNAIDLDNLDKFASNNYFIHFVGGMFHEFVTQINFNIFD